jgi:2'-5' RNA ligase
VTLHNPTLQKLYSKISRLLELPEAEPLFHVTLMRVKSIIDPEGFFERLRIPSAPAIGIMEPRIVLYQSFLLPEGAKYETLHEWHVQEDEKE